MKQGRPSLTITAISALALALGLGLGLLGAASASATAHSSTSAAAGLYSERTVVISCQNRTQVRPGTFTLACADGNDYLTGLSWTSWTSRLASGYGTQHENDCIPYCAAGHFHAYPVLVVLWGSGPLRGNPGTQHYTRMTLIYPGARPKVYDGHRWVEPTSTTTSLWS
jgi:hypothetical protein